VYANKATGDNLCGSRFMCSGYGKPSETMYVLNAGN